MRNKRHISIYCRTRSYCVLWSLYSTNSIKEYNNLAQFVNFTLYKFYCGDIIYDCSSGCALFHYENLYLD